MATKKSAAAQLQPAVLPLARPDCDVAEALAIGRAEIMNLFRWVHLVECSRCEFEIDPRELAEMVGQRLQPVIQLFDQALDPRRAAQ